MGLRWDCPVRASRIKFDQVAVASRRFSCEPGCTHLYIALLSSIPEGSMYPKNIVFWHNSTYIGYITCSLDPGP